MNVLIPLIVAGGIVLAISSKKRRKTASGSTPVLHDAVVPDLNTGANFLVFEAEWCQACKKAKPLLVGVRDRHPAIAFTFADIDRNAELAQKYEITGIPTAIALVDGKEIDRIIGAGTMNRYESAALKLEGAKPLPSGS